MRKLLRVVLAAALAIVSLAPGTRFVDAATKPTCIGTNKDTCVAVFTVGPSWLKAADDILRRFNQDKRSTLWSDAKSGTVTMIGSPNDVNAATAAMNQLGRKVGTFGDKAPVPSPSPSDLALCDIDGVDPLAATSVLQAVIGFLNGGTNVPTPPPSPSPSPAGSTTPTPAPTPIPTPAFSAKNGSVLLDSGQQRIIVHLVPQAVEMLRSALAAFTNQPAAAFKYYEVRYSVPDPIAPSTTVPVTGELSSAPTTTTAATSSVQTLATAVSNLMAGTGVTVVPDANYPRILVTGPAPLVEQALQLLNDLDKRPAEILLQLQYYEIDTVKARDFGVQIPSSISASVGAYISPTAAGAATPAPIFHGKLVTSAAPIVPFTLNTLMNDGVATLESAPQMETLNGRLAVIDVGQIIPFTANTLNSSGVLVPGIVNYTVGTHLEITPFINFDGSISVYVHPINSTLTGFTVQNAPQIDRRELSANFRLKPGEAVNLSGLKEQTTSSIKDGFPLLSLIPVLGGAVQEQEHQRHEPATLHSAYRFHRRCG